MTTENRTPRAIPWKRIAIASGIVLTVLIIFTLITDRWVINDLTDPLKDKSLNAVPEKSSTSVPGMMFTSTLINLLQTEFDRPFGGYRPDNVMWFGGIVPMDNVESFQKGVVEVVQRTVIYLKERVSRAGGGSDEFDELLVKASESLNYKKESIFLTRWQFKEGLGQLKAYRDNLKISSRFVVRTDSLYDLLRIYRDLLGDTHKNLAKWQEKDGSPVSTFDTDNYYYMGLGQAYATLALMRAAEVEFKEILEMKGCMIYMKELETSLAYATDPNPPWIILDGSVNAQFWPNHRSNLETHINDARFKLVSMMDNINR